MGLLNGRSNGLLGSQTTVLIATTLALGATPGSDLATTGRERSQ